jgi:hypothetical protein
MARKMRGGWRSSAPLPGEEAREEKEGAQRGPEGGAVSQLLRTAEVLEKTRITHQVLYRYITLGLIEPARTTETGVRLFHPDVVHLIEIVKSLNQSGYSLRDMKDIFFKDERVKRMMSKSG